MNEHLFRKKSIDRVSFPKQLNEYIRVPPGVWMVLLAIVILLAGVCAWGEELGIRSYGTVVDLLVTYYKDFL